MTLLLANHEGVYKNNRMGIVILFLLAVVPQLAHAKTLLWSQNSAIVGINEHFGIYGEIQPRWDNDFHHLQAVLYRTALLYRFDPRLRVGFGYAWVPQERPTERNENRIFQQVEWNPDLGTPPQWKYAIRGRFEQRFVENANGPNFRVRTRVEVAWMPSQFGPYLWDELFFSLNEKPRTLINGFDQNRLSVGLRYQMNSNFRAEFGYLVQSLRQVTTEVDSNSGVLLNLSLILW